MSCARFEPAHDIGVDVGQRGDLDAVRDAVALLESAGVDEPCGRSGVLSAEAESRCACASSLICAIACTRTSRSPAGPSRCPGGRRRWMSAWFADSNTIRRHGTASSCLRAAGARGIRWPRSTARRCAAGHGDLSGAARLRCQRGPARQHHQQSRLRQPAVVHAGRRHRCSSPRFAAAEPRPTSIATTSRPARPSQVTRTPESEYSPTVTPDGAHISVIRVEADGTQRLWRFTLDGGAPELVLAGVKPVGYHAWADDHTLVLFVLGSPATLQLADTSAGDAEILVTGINRSIQRIPGRHDQLRRAHDGEGGATPRCRFASSIRRPSASRRS